MDLRNPYLFSDPNPLGQSTAAARASRKDRIKISPNWRYWPSASGPQDLTDAEALPELLSHPELEDHATIAWGLKQCAVAKEWSATVDVLDCRGTDVEWKINIGDDELGDIVANALDPSDIQDRGLRIFFLDTLQSNAGWLPGNFSIRPETLRSLQKAGLSGIILNQIFSAEGVWSRMGNQCFTKNDSRGTLSSFEVCYHYVCGWDTGYSFTQLLRNKTQTTYFCVNYPSRALERFKVYLKTDPNLAYRDFFLDVLAHEDSLRQWQFDIGERRKQLLYHEKRYNNEGNEYSTATLQLHKLSYDWHTLGQDCKDQARSLDFLHSAYDKYMTRLQNESNQWEVNTSNNMGEILDVLKSQCDNCARWTTVYRERTNIRINLLFHLANQTEAKTNTAIATSSAKIAEQTQRDSASMITMAAVTMFFLPGTFISTILSTTFFDYGDDALSVSKKWWILPASTIPITFAVFAVWMAWRWWRIRKQMVERNGKRNGSEETVQVIRPNLK